MNQHNDLPLLRLPHPVIPHAAKLVPVEEVTYEQLPHAKRALIGTGLMQEWHLEEEDFQQRILTTTYGVRNTLVGGILMGNAGIYFGAKAFAAHIEHQKSTGPTPHTEKEIGNGIGAGTLFILGLGSIVAARFLMDWRGKLIHAFAENKGTNKANVTILKRKLSEREKQLTYIQE